MLYKKLPFLVLSVIIVVSINLHSETRNWEQLYPTINRPVADMRFSSFSEISEYGLLFALPGAGGGLAYFTNQDSLNIFNISTNLGAVSVVPDEENSRIFCAFGRGSNSDGLYEFDLETEEFERIDWFFYPQFVKKLSSGFYFGYGHNEQGGFVHSENGNDWNAIAYFNMMPVTDVEENVAGTLFVSVGNEIFMGNNGDYSSYDTGLVINDIYIRNDPHNDEVYLACGDGGYINMLYKVEYSDGTITGLTSIHEMYYPHKIYEYREFLVVGCNEQAGLYLVEPEENGQSQLVSLDPEIMSFYCFEFYPIYEHNFMVGTSSGVYLFTNLTSVDETELETVNSCNLSNYPNPFKPAVAGRGPGTTISFELNKKFSENTEIEIYNLKGQKTRSLPVTLSGVEGSGNDYTVSWNGTNRNNQPVSSGIYYAILKSEGRVLGKKKMVLLK